MSGPAVKCSHARTKSGSINGYTGSVAVHPYTDENRAAHGGITYTVECLDCGARRRENTNGLAIEVSPWRGSRAGRREDVARLRRELDAARNACDPAVVRRSDGREVSVVVEEDGMATVQGVHDTGEIPQIIASLSSEWHAAAVRVRTAYLAVQDAQRAEDLS